MQVSKSWPSLHMQLFARFYTETYVVTSCNIGSRIHNYVEVSYDALGIACYVALT